MLKITRAIEAIEVKNLTVCVYSVPGIGKTSLGFTAADPMLLDFDLGAHRSRNRRDSSQIYLWKDVADMTADDLKGFKTVVVDTGGRALDALSVDIIAHNPKLGRGGALTLQGYGELKSSFVSWIKWVRSLGLDVVLLCHSDEQRSGDDLIERLDMQGGSKGEIYKSTDVMGRLYLSGGQRMLNFSPTDTAFGKNPAQFPALAVPDFDSNPNFLATVIADVKAALNKLSAQQTAVVAALGTWKERIDAAVTCGDFDALLTPAQGEGDSVRDNVKRMIVKAAKARGFSFNKTTKAFDLAEAPKAEEKAAS